MELSERLEVDAEESSTRAGYVALVGRPNVGKSSLMNALVGERLSIVTPRAQTTRDRVLGIHTSPEGQMIFVDTPGILTPKYLLQHGMLSAALSAITESDAVLLILDGTQSVEAAPDTETLELLRRRIGSLFVAINKIDAATPAAVEALRSWSLAEFELEPHLVSAATGAGVDELRSALIEALPASPYLYPPDDLAVQPVRFFVAEFVRETIFEECHEEVPYSTAVAIEEFRESADPIVIRAVIYVERDSQKAIVIGRGGAGIKQIGLRSREKIEEFLGQRVYLDLWVKTLPRWRKRRGALRQLGYTLPPESGNPD